MRGDGKGMRHGDGADRFGNNYDPGDSILIILVQRELGELTQICARRSTVYVEWPVTNRQA